MALPSLKSQADETLHQELKTLRGTECKTIAEIVLRLAEIDSRGIYRDAGYSSLFAYCTEGLGYSEGSAWRRIAAARALRENPEIYGLLGRGQLSLCAVAQVSKVLTAENKCEILPLVQGKPKVEVERIAAHFGKIVAVPRKPESVRVLRREVSLPETRDLFAPRAAPSAPVEERFSVTFELTAEEMEIVEAARRLIGRCKIKDVVVRTAKEFVSRRGRKPSTRKVAATVAAKSANPLKSRYIAKGVQLEVRDRDGAQCTYVSPEGKRCTERHGLQFDHAVPFSLGGGNEAENLRLVCAAHNQLYAERVFGRERMREFAGRTR